MIIVFPFCDKDQQQAERWMRWVGELGGCKPHSVILMPAKKLWSTPTDEERQRLELIEELAGKAFGDVSTARDYEGITGHPEGPNCMMRQALWYCAPEPAGKNIGPWTFMEPDCIPLVPDWLDKWEYEYRGHGKPFMGELRPAHDVTPDYLTGNMVLPKSAILLAPLLGAHGLSRDRVELAFDIVSASQTLPQAHLTKLLQQVPKPAPGSGVTFPDQQSLSILRPGAVLFHPCKDGTLIDRLREKKGGVAVCANESKVPNESTKQAPISNGSLEKVASNAAPPVQPAGAANLIASLDTAHVGSERHVVSVVNLDRERMLSEEVATLKAEVQRILGLIPKKHFKQKGKRKLSPERKEALRKQLVEMRARKAAKLAKV